MALFGGPSQPQTRLEELKRLLQRDPTSRQFLALAEEYRRHAKYRDAVITLERGLALHSTSVAGHVALGKTYQQLDRLEDAIRAFTNALRIDRENLVAIRQLAEVYLAKGDKIEAIKKLKLYRGLKAGDRDVNDIIARLEQEMSAAVVDRGFQSGVRPAVPAPSESRVPSAGPPSSSTSRRASLLRRLEVPPPETAPPPARSAEALELTYDRASVAAALEQVRPPAEPPAPPPPAPASAIEEAFLESSAPRIRSGERVRGVSPFTAPIEQVHEPGPPPAVEIPPPPSPAAPPAAEVAPPPLEPVPPPAPAEPSPLEAAAPAVETAPPPAAPFPAAEFDADDVPTAPFEFPVHLYRVGSAPEPAPEPEAFETLAAFPMEPPSPPVSPAPPPPPAAEPLVSETLANLYEKQGYTADARETYRTLAESEADAERARALREKAAALPPAERTDRPRLRRLSRRFPKRVEATANELHTIIRALVESTEGIRAATLTDLEGLPVVTAGPGARESGQEILVAELTSFLKNVSRSREEVGAGALRAMTLAGAHGTAVVARVNDDYSLILHVDPDAILGEVRWEAERTARALIPAVR